MVIFFDIPLDTNDCSSYSMDRTKVLIKEESLMTGWTFFFILVGAALLTAQLFRAIDAIERPARRSRRRVSAR